MTQITIEVKQLNNLYTYMYYVCLHIFIIVLNNGILRTNVSKRHIYYLYIVNLYYNMGKSN